LLRPSRSIQESENIFAQWVCWMSQYFFFFVSDWTALTFCPSKTVISFKTAKASQKHRRKWWYYCTMITLNESAHFYFRFQLNCCHFLSIQNSCSPKITRNNKKVTIFFYNKSIV
jgi:hypothetical protein